MEERYTFETSIHGAGGFAKVIKGRDNFLERDIAIKILDKLVSDSTPTDIERFHREAKILAQLSHKNIPSIYDVKLDNDSFKIIFEFIEGNTLKKLIAEEGPCQLEEVKSWFIDIASALDYAHSKDIIYRDIKPENIIISLDRTASFLVDFGIALSGEDSKKLTRSGFIIGTRGYMSPEQMGGESLDNRTDIFSLGVSLYEALAGSPLRMGRYESLSIKNEGIPPKIDELIQDCIKNKEERISTVKDFISKLTGSMIELRPLSEVLGRGRLHELAAKIETMSSSDIFSLPEGQKALILAKIEDILDSNEQSLEYACARFLNLLIIRGVLLTKNEYRPIVNNTIIWGFEKTFGENIGKEQIRRSLGEAIYISKDEPHDVIRDCFSEFLNRTNFEDMEDWYLHSVRDIISRILANPSCRNGTLKLVESLNKVNKIQRSRSRQKNLF